MLNSFNASNPDINQTFSQSLRICLTDDRQIVLDLLIYLLYICQTNKTNGVNMSVLSRAEEMVLLAVWRLQDNAYGVTIAKKLTETTEKDWVLGHVYVPLERLEKKSFLESYLGNSTNKRGGRSKRLYRLTKLGLKALIEIKKTEGSIWKDISVFALEKEL